MSRNISINQKFLNEIAREPWRLCGAPKRTQDVELQDGRWRPSATTLFNQRRVRRLENRSRTQASVEHINIIALLFIPRPGRGETFDEAHRCLERPDLLRIGRKRPIISFLDRLRWRGRIEPMVQQDDDGTSGLRMQAARIIEHILEAQLQPGIAREFDDRAVSALAQKIGGIRNIGTAGIRRDNRDRPP